MTYDEGRHALLHQIAHKALLAPSERGEFVERVRAAGIEVVDVGMPDWPPVEYAPLALVFGGDGQWWEGRHWTGSQPAVSSEFALRPDGDWSRADVEARKIARAMRGDPMAPKRLAYAWHCEAYDPARHIAIRYQCEAEGRDIVEWWREFYPEAKARHGDFIVTVTDPMAAEDAAAGRSFSPTTRALRARDRAIWDEFAARHERFEDDFDLSVSWARALDGSRWEARRQHAPQSATWMSTRSFVQRPIGEGAWTEADRGPDGHAFGPFMELFDDGALYAWVDPRVLERLESEPLAINGVPVRMVPETGIPRYNWRVAGRIPPESMEQALAGAEAPAAASSGKERSAAAPQEEPEPAVSGFQHHRGPWHHADSPLPDEFHRSDPRYGRPALIVKRAEGDCQVRVWGDPSLARGVTVNGIRVEGFSPTGNGGWKAPVSMETADLILRPALQERGERDSDAGEAAAPVVPTPPPPRPADALTDGARVYSPAAVVEALEEALGRSVRLFGRSASDAAIVALADRGLDMFLAECETDRERYVADRGHRNYDCENFAESMRCDLQRKHGVNGAGVIWGDGHAWVFFAVAAGDRPGIRMVEPQSDEPVTRLSGEYSVERRCEVLL